MGNGVDVPAEQITAGQWLTRCLAMIKPTVEPNTYRPYEQPRRNHITPILVDIRLTKLKRGDIINFYSVLASNGVSLTYQRKVGTTRKVKIYADCRAQQGC